MINQIIVGDDECHVAIRNLDGEDVSTGVSVAFIQDRSSVWKTYWDSKQQTQSLLLEAIKEDDPNFIHTVLSEATEPDFSFQYHNQRKCSLLHLCCFLNRPACALAAIRHLGAVNTQMQPSLRTALHIAIESKNEQLTALLISQGADPKIVDNEGSTSLHYLTEWDCLDIMHLFQELVPMEEFFKGKNRSQMTAFDCLRTQQMYNRLIPYIPSDYKPHFWCQRWTKGLWLRFSRKDFVERFLSRQPQFWFEQGQGSIKLSLTHQESAQSYESPLSKSRRENPLVKSRKMTLIAKNLSLMHLQQNNKYSHSSINDYYLKGLLGQGGFSDVLLGRLADSSHLVAIKRVQKHKILQQNLKKYLFAERDILLSLSHPFVVEVHRLLQDDKYLYIVMEHCSGGDLSTALDNHGSFSQEETRIYAAELALALDYVHKTGILFRDLKCANVLLDGKGHVRLADFGLAKRALVSYSFLGSPAYLAPEMLTDQSLNEHSVAMDWYHFGALIYELLTGKPPFYSDDEHKLMKAIRTQPVELPVRLSSECKSLLNLLLRKEPAMRMQSLTQLKNHQWFRSLNWDHVIDKKLKVPNLKTTTKISPLPFSIAESGQFIDGWDG